MKTKTLINGRTRTEIIIEYCKDFDYGDTLYYDKVSELLQIPKEQKREFSHGQWLEDLKEYMMLNHKMLENIRGVGYRVAYPKDYLVHIKRRESRANTEFKNAKKIIANAPFDLIGLEQSMVMRNANTIINFCLPNLHSAINKINAEIKKQKEGK